MMFKSAGLHLHVIVISTNNSAVDVVLCRKVADALLNIMNAVGTLDTRWLLAVPLYHCLSNTVKPFARTSVSGCTSHRKPEWWGIADFDKVVEGSKETWRANM